jgi:hypothetical protein
MTAAPTPAVHGPEMLADPSARCGGGGADHRDRRYATFYNDARRPASVIFDNLPLRAGAHHHVLLRDPGPGLNIVVSFASLLDLGYVAFTSSGYTTAFLARPSGLRRGGSWSVPSASRPWPGC